MSHPTDTPDPLTPDPEDGTSCADCKTPRNTIHGALCSVRAGAKPGRVLAAPKTLTREEAPPVERDPVAVHEGYCGALSADAMACTRRPHTDGEHVAEGVRGEVLERWTTPADRVTEEALDADTIAHRIARGWLHDDGAGESDLAQAIEEAIESERERAAAEVRALRAIIVRANNLLFEVQPDISDAKHAIECHADTVPAAYLRLAKGASAAANVLGAEVCEMLEPTIHPAPVADASLDARAQAAFEVYELQGFPSEKHRRAAVVRAVDASRPSTPERTFPRVPLGSVVPGSLIEIASGEIGVKAKDRPRDGLPCDVLWIATGTIGEMHPVDTVSLRATPAELDALTSADAGRPGLTEEQARCRHCRAPLPDHTPTCAVVHIAQEDGFPTISAAYEQWVTRNNGEPRGEAPPVPADATGGLGPEPGTPASHVSIPRAALAALVKATQYEPDVRVEREIARTILQLAALAAEPARTDPEAARGKARRTTSTNLHVAGAALVLQDIARSCAALTPDDAPARLELAPAALDLLRALGAVITTTTLYEAGKRRRNTTTARLTVDALEILARESHDAEGPIVEPEPPPAILPHILAALRRVRDALPTGDSGKHALTQALSQLEGARDMLAIGRVHAAIDILSDIEPEEDAS